MVCTFFSPLQVHFFALFGITSYEDVMSSKYLQGWTFYMFKLVFASYLTLSIIVLINLLIAMMSDTYCRIQEQSDIGEVIHFRKICSQLLLFQSGSLVLPSLSGTCREPMWLLLHSTCSPLGWCCLERGSWRGNMRR